MPYEFNQVAQGYSILQSRSPSGEKQKALAMVSSLKDVEEASALQKKHINIPIALTKNTQASIAAFKQQYSGEQLFEQLTRSFTNYGIPLGMINRLQPLTKRRLDFLIDDSGSMFGRSNVPIEHAQPWLKEIFKNAYQKEHGFLPASDAKMSRWQEAENRLHILIELLAYLNIPHIQIRFLNRDDVVVFSREGKTFEAYKEEAHRLIRTQFSNGPDGGTPALEQLRTGFNAPNEWFHYFFNDGEPAELSKVVDCINNRPNSFAHPLNLMSCTDKKIETVWMRKVDGSAPHTGEINDYEDEAQEVLEKQGIGFSYTWGYWIVCQLVAALNPDDLDALDETLPFTKKTYDEIQGRELSPYEYQYYFENNPNAALYVAEYERFLTEDCVARHIISKEEQNQRELAAGYRDGERPKKPIEDITHLLLDCTQREVARLQAFYAEQSTDLPPSYHSEERPNEDVVRSSVSVAPNSAFIGTSGVRYRDSDRTVEPVIEGGCCTLS